MSTDRLARLQRGSVSASNERRGASNDRSVEMDLVAASRGWQSSGKGFRGAAVPPHLLNVPQACLATVRSLWATLNHFQRKAAGLSSCALHECEHRSARPNERKYRLQRFLLFSLLVVGGAWAVANASRLIQHPPSPPAAPAVALMESS